MTLILCALDLYVCFSIKITFWDGFKTEEGFQGLPFSPFAHNILEACSSRIMGKVVHCISGFVILMLCFIFAPTISTSSSTFAKRLFFTITCMRNPAGLGLVNNHQICGTNSTFQQTPKTFSYGLWFISPGHVQVFKAYTVVGARDSCNNDVCMCVSVIFGWMKLVLMMW